MDHRLVTAVIILVCGIMRANSSAATNANGSRECFWGFDHMGQVVDHLGLARPKGGGWTAML